MSILVILIVIYASVTVNDWSACNSLDSNVFAAFRNMIRCRLPQKQHYINGGDIRWVIEEGDRVERGQLLGSIRLSECYGGSRIDVLSPVTGWVTKTNKSTTTFEGKNIMDVESGCRAGNIVRFVNVFPTPDPSKFRCSMTDGQVCVCPLSLHNVII